jgi:Arc/MetJ-type ribon-helix-helix transcriptional regulator
MGENPNDSEETVFTVRLDKRTREDWREYVKNTSEFNSASQLVRVAVAEYIQRDSDDTPYQKEIQESNEEILVELYRLLEITERIEEMTKSVNKQTTQDRLSDIIEESSYEALELYNNNPNNTTNDE